MGPVRPDDVSLLTIPASPALYGDLLLVAVNRPDPRTNEYPGSVRRVDLADGTVSAWTAGPRDSHPVLSPDGATLAFLRAEEGKKPQLHVMPTGGGEARRLTDLALGVSDPVWSPDSGRIAFVARVPEPGRYGTPETEGADAPE